MNKIKEIEQQINRDNLIYEKVIRKRAKYMIFKRSFGRETYNGIVILNNVFEEEIIQEDEIDKFSESTKPKNANKKERKY